MSERLERLINLTATLLATRRPLTLEELADRLSPGYPDDLAARRRQFERDKETLRDLGIPIAVESVDGWSGADLGYRIHPDEYYLPDLGLDPAERAALHLAATAVDVGGVDPLDALRKLGGAEGSAAAAPVASFAVTPHLGACFDAVARRCVLTFPYRNEERRLEPAGILHRFGHWYVVGRDVDRDQARSFRIGRFDGPPELGPGGAFVPADDLDPASVVSSDPLAVGDDRPVTARVLVDATRAALVTERLGERAVVESRPNGSVVVELAVVNRDAFREFVLDLLEHAEVLAPPELRTDLVDRLATLAGGPVSRTTDPGTGA